VSTETPSDAAQKGFFRAWWRELGPLQGVVRIVLIVESIIGLYLFFNAFYAHRSFQYSIDGSISILYPAYIPLSQKRPFVLRAQKPVQSLVVQVPSEIILTVLEGPRASRREDVQGEWVVWEWNSLDQPEEIILQIEPAGTFLVNTPVDFKVCADGTCVYLRRSIWIEGVLCERLRIIGQALIFIIAGSLGYLWSSFQTHQRRQREHELRARVLTLRELWREVFPQPEEFDEQISELQPYLYTSVLQTKDGVCLNYIIRLNNLWDSSKEFHQKINRLTKYLNKIQNECPNWVDVTLSWLEKVQADLSYEQKWWFRSWLRSLLFNANVNQERVGRLLQRISPIPMWRWWPESCSLFLSLSTNLSSPKQKLLFPEPVLDALHPETQYWLFGPPNYFWHHPLFENLSQWIRQQSSRLSETRVIQIAGVEASGRTTFALAISEYFPDSDYLGVYIANPQEESDFRQAWATRLLDFVCCHASDLGLIQPTLQALFFTLWLNLWPRSVLRARLHRCWFRWSSSDSEAHSDLAGISKVAQSVLQLWLEALDGFNLPTPLSHSAWWTALTEALFFIHEVRPWKGLIIAVDWDSGKPPLGDWLSTLDAIANTLPVTWLVFTRTSLDLSSDVAHRYNLLWTPKDLVEMVRHRKFQVYGPNFDDKPPLISEIEKWALETNGSPRRMGELYLAWYRRFSGEAIL